MGTFYEVVKLDTLVESPDAALRPDLSGSLRRMAGARHAVPLLIGIIAAYGRGTACRALTNDLPAAFFRALRSG